MKKLLVILCLFSAAGALSAYAETMVRFRTPLGDIDVQLFPNAAPDTVANFLAHVDDSSYANSFVQRVYRGSTIQGGDFNVDAYGNVLALPAQPPVPNEFGLSNVRGTLAMTKSGSSTDSDSNLWFFNLADNSASLDNQNGGFTVFGQIVNAQGLEVINAIAALTLYNVYLPERTYLDIPMIHFLNATGVDITPYLAYTHIARLPASAFFAEQVPVSEGIYYLAFAQTGSPFGYYTYLSDANYIYHFDLGYEYIFDANDGKSGVYLYDFTSGHFFYTSPSFPFPYLYDFNLQAFLYYYPDPDQTANPDRYNTDGVRYFYNFNTGQIFVQ